MKFKNWALVATCALALPLPLVAVVIVPQPPTQLVHRQTLMVEACL